MELTLIGFGIMLLSMAAYLILKAYFKKRLDEIDGFDGIITEELEDEKTNSI